MRVRTATAKLGAVELADLTESVNDDARRILALGTRLCGLGDGLDAESRSDAEVRACQQLFPRLATRCAVAAGAITLVGNRLAEHQRQIERKVASQVNPEPGERHFTAAPTMIPVQRIRVDNPQVQALFDASLALTSVAQEVRSVSNHVSGLLGDRYLAQSIARWPLTGMRLERAIIRTVTQSAGLGLVAPVQVRLGRVVHFAGTLAGRGNLAADIAALALRLRICAVGIEHPEIFEDELMASMITAVVEDHQFKAVRLFRKLNSSMGGEKAIAAIAPIYAELVGLFALLDENPYNDDTGWAILTGGALPAEPLTGISLPWFSRNERKKGRAERIQLGPEDRAHLRQNGSLLDYLHNLQVVRNDGRVLLHQVGEGKYALLLPGMGPDGFNNDTPQDLAGAVCNTNLPESSYTRAVEKALTDAELPNDVRLLIIGHSAGGVTAMNLAQKKDFTTRYRVTHVVAIGSPVDHKTPADPRTWVATVTNEHDIVPILDGRGPGSPHPPHPGWYEVDYTDGTHDFPLCHSLSIYIGGLENSVPEARTDIDREIADYHGEITETLVYRLYDK